MRRGDESFPLGSNLERGGLSWFLKGVEAYYKGKYKESFRRVWNEGGRGFKLELCSNKTDRFMLCSTLSAEEKVTV